MSVGLFVPLASARAMGCLACPTAATRFHCPTAPTATNRLHATSIAHHRLQPATHCYPAIAAIPIVLLSCGHLSPLLPAIASIAEIPIVLLCSHCCQPLLMGHSKRTGSRDCGLTLA